jgi:hypothetical protein
VLLFENYPRDAITATLATGVATVRLQIPALSMNTVVLQ